GAVLLGVFDHCPEFQDFEYAAVLPYPFLGIEQLAAVPDQVSDDNQRQQHNPDGNAGERNQNLKNPDEQQIQMVLVTAAKGKIPVKIARDILNRNSLGNAFIDLRILADDIAFLEQTNKLVIEIDGNSIGF